MTTPAIIAGAFVVGLIVIVVGSALKVASDDDDRNHRNEGDDRIDWEAYDMWLEEQG